MVRTSAARFDGGPRQTRGYGDTKDLDILMAELGDVQSHLQARQQALRELEGR